MFHVAAERDPYPDLFRVSPERTTANTRRGHGFYKPKNIKVLPENTDLRKVMHQYTGDLGAECEFCHTMPDPVTKHPDFASDAVRRKDKVRYMIRMTNDLNDKYLTQLPDRDQDDPISCGTCHRGEKRPSVFVAPQRQEGNRQPGAPPMATPSASTPTHPATN